jgi:hypothetical protein
VLGAQPGGADPWYPAVQNVSDSMHRTVPLGLGTADVGGTYTASPPTNFAVLGDAGHVRTLAPGQTASAILSGVLNADQRLQLVFSVPKVPAYGRGEYVSVLLRRQANGDNYSARAYVTAGGALILDLIQIKGGVERRLSPDIDTGQRVAAGEQVVLQGQVTGSGSVTLQGRAWKSSGTAPNWQLTATDSAGTRIPAAGRVGILAYTSTTSPAGGLTLAGLSGWALKSTPTVTPSSATPTHSAAPSTAKPTPAPSISATSTTASSTTARPAPSASAPAPTPTPTVTGAPPTPAGGQGAQPIGSASYPVPSGAVFVAPSGSDGSGTGAISAPLATIQAALSRVGAGGTIVLRAGNYNEDLFIGKSGITIQNYPGEAAWLDGSVPVTGWTQSGNTWVHSGWGAQFDWSQSFSSGSNAGGFVDGAYPLAAAPDQTFVDGQQLQQVLAGPGPGQFAVNYSSRTITVGSNPNGHAIRASNLTQAIVVSAGNVTLRGFGVRNYATPLPQIGTVFLGGSSGGCAVQNVVIQDNATQGLSIDAPNTMVDHVTATNNGMTGIHANGADHSTVQNSVVTGNNTQHFNPAPSAAGIKFTRLDGFTVRNNDVQNNANVNAIWADENVTHFTIVGNTVAGNGPQYGILTELSDTGVVANNSISGAKYGYTAFDTGNVDVYNNSLSNNVVWDVGLSQDNRYQPGRGTAGPSVQPSAADPWRVRNVTVANNVFGGSGGEMFQFYALDKETNIPVDAMNITVNGNLFAGGPATMVGWGAGDNVTVAQYQSPQSLDSAKGKNWTNARPGGAVTTSVVAANQGIAVTMPSNVAAAVGVPAGTQRLGTF